MTRSITPEISSVAGLRSGIAAFIGDSFSHGRSALGDAFQEAPSAWICLRPEGFGSAGAFHRCGKPFVPPQRRYTEAMVTVDCDWMGAACNLEVGLSTAESRRGRDSVPLSVLITGRRSHRPPLKVTTQKGHNLTRQPSHFGQRSKTNPRYTSPLKCTPAKGGALIEHLTKHL